MHRSGELFDGRKIVIYEYHKGRDHQIPMDFYKKNTDTVKQSVAYQALHKIAAFYHIDTELKALPAAERLQKRQEQISPLVEDFFAWVKQQVLECIVPPRSKTAQGLNYIMNQEKNLRVFLTDGNVPIDNSASERAIRTFCIGKKN